MSTKRERRQARRRQKHKKKRQQARRIRGSRTPPAGPGSATLEEAVDWPVGEAWVGERWHERGAHLHAVFTRRSDDGRAAAALFELDLAERGVVSARGVSGVSEAAIQGELVRRSSDEQAMVSVEPALLVKLVHAAREHGTSLGHAQPSDLERVATLFGHVRAADAPQEILCGTEEAPVEPEPEPDGFLATLKRRLGLGG